MTKPAQGSGAGTASHGGRSSHRPHRSPCLRWRNRNGSCGRRHRRLAALALLVCLIGLVSVSAGPALAKSNQNKAKTTRSTTDRKDQQTGYQIHALYVLPSNGVDRQFDTNGQIANSVASFNDWLSGQTGGRRLRTDTRKGALDITFRRLSRTDADIASEGGFVREAIERELKPAGFNQAQKLYLVYYDGGSNVACGAAPWPPLIPGNVVAMYLKGTPPGSGPVCNTNVLGASRTALGYWEFAMLHDTLHAFGLAPSCAPNEYRNGHVSDSPNDLMWAGNAPWQLPPKLDIGRNDYFEHGRVDCPDLARSVFLNPLPANAQVPPGWAG